MGNCRWCNQHTKGTYCSEKCETEHKVLNPSDYKAKQQGDVLGCMAVIAVIIGALIFRALGCE